MSKPESIKVEPWSQFPKQSYDIMTDDFCHDKLFTCKAGLKSDKSQINVKETVAKKSGNYSMQDQIKLWFGLPHERTLYAHIKSNNYLKLHVDHGLYEINGKKWNIYSSANSNSALQNISFKLGFANTFSKKCQSDNRFKISVQDNVRSLHWYHRTMVYYEKVHFGILGVFDIFNKVVQKNDLLLKYCHNQKHDVYLRAQVEGFRGHNFQLDNPKSYFDSVRMNYVGRINPDVKIGLEAKIDTDQLKLSHASAVVEKSFGQGKQVVKVKVDDKLNINLTHTRPIPLLNNLGKFTYGCQVSQIGSKSRSFSQGFQFDLNL